MQINSNANTAFNPSSDRATPSGKSTQALGSAAGSDTEASATGGSGTQDASTGLKSFAYGVLGLESPTAQAQDSDTLYTAGKWLAAAVTVGGIVSLFV